MPESNVVDKMKDKNSHESPESSWLKFFIKGMKESLKTGLRYHPKEDDVAKLSQIAVVIKSFRQKSSQNGGIN